MKKFSYILLLIGTFMLCFWMGSCSPPAPNQLISLNVGAAGMVRFAFEQIDDLYAKEQPHVVMSYQFAGNKVLENSLKSGEKFDILLFASQPPMDKLQSEGLILPESRRNLFTTDMVLIVPVTSTLSITDFQDLTSDRVQKIAIGSSRISSGNYSKQILTKLGIYEQVQRKAIWADIDVREVLRAVEDGEVDAGITFLPEAKISSVVKIVAVASKDSYHPVTAVAAISRESSHIKEATAFLNFLTTQKAVTVFEELGIKLLQ